MNYKQNYHFSVADMVAFLINVTISVWNLALKSPAVCTIFLNIVKNYILSKDSVFCMVLTPNSDCFPKQQ
jgi:hypothetical protein